MEGKPWHRHYDYTVPTTIRYPRLAVHELLGIPANAYPDEAALNFYGTERLASFFDTHRWLPQPRTAPGPGESGRSRPHSVYRRDDWDSQGGGSHAC